MEKIMKFMVVVILVMFMAITANADGIKCSSVNDADDYFTHGEKALAKDCIETIIKAEPGNNKAYFLKGKYALSDNDFQTAKTALSSGPVKAKYRSEIAELYRTEGEKRLAVGDVNLSRTCFAEMTDYNPALAKIVAADLASKGKKLNSDNYLTMATQLDPTLKTPIADHIASLNAKTDDEKAANLKRSSMYDSMKYGQKFNDFQEPRGRAFLAKAKANAKLQGKEAEDATNKFKKMARDCFKGTPSEGLVEKELPEVVEYTPRAEKYRFPLVAGQQTDHWISTNSFHVNYYSEKECLYDVLYEDGYVSKKGERRALNNDQKIKFRAYSTCTQNGGIGLLAQ